jgi:hypothetical protein
MSALAKRLFFAAEDVLQKVLEAGHGWRAALAARWWLRRKSDLRGTACHCPPGLPLHLVHSEGLREGADVVVDFRSNISGRARRQVPVAALARVAPEIGDGDIVHVKADRMAEFVAHVFPRVRGPVVLVSGDSDYGAVGDFRHLLDDPKLRHWFAQNCDVPWRHPKLTRIPIGFDNPRYDKLEKRIGFLIEMALGKTPYDPTVSRNDIGDQARLQQVAAQIATRPHRKPLRALCTFHLNQKLVPNFEELPERRQAYELLKDNPACHFPARRLPQEECWRRHADFAFQVSPRGRGLDCFRTWESLFLGTIPIVRSSTLDPLYLDENLPVVIVESYREVEPGNLARWKAQYEDRFTPELRTRLTNGYWLDRIRAAAAPGQGTGR